jgi:hypothetical protein
MGLCGSSIPDEILPDPTGPSKFFMKKKGMMSRNFDIYQNDEDGGKWLQLKKEGGRVSDKAKISIENFVKDEESGHFGVLAFCNFDTLDSDAYKQSDMETHSDSDDSDYSDDESDTEAEQKCKWKCKTKSHFYKDKSKKEKTFTLRVKAKGKAKRKVEFHEYEDAEGHQAARASVSMKIKVKKFFYKLSVGVPGEGEGVEESKAGEGGPPLIPLELHGNLNKGARKLHWTCPMFEADVEGKSGNKLSVETKEGCDPAAAALIAYIAAIELAPEDIADKAKAVIHWPTVHGPHGASA